MSASTDLAERLFAELAEATADPLGVTRAAYGQGEQFAHDLMQREAGRLGCETRVDAAGNLAMTLPGTDRDRPCLMIGSHLDSVPHGGNYDGAAGVIAGLALIADLAERGVVPMQDITVMAFRGEEAAWFPISYLGSCSALGLLSPALLKTPRSDTGVSLADHMQRAGFKPDVIARGEPQLDRNRVAAFIEVHIEQGPVLIGADKPIGLVTGINGGFRYMSATVSGAWDHSGATPRSFRRDAVLGFNAFVRKLEDAWNQIEAASQSATITFGQVATNPALHGGSRVAGNLTFSLDVRSQFAGVLENLQIDLVRFCAEVTLERDVQVDLGEEFSWPIASISPALLATLETTADAVDVPFLRMPSGAGHDAAVMAEAGIPTAMVFVRSTNGSHNPDEAMDIADLDQAVTVLSQLVRSQSV